MCSAKSKVIHIQKKCSFSLKRSKSVFARQGNRVSHRQAGVLGLAVCVSSFFVHDNRTSRLFVALGVPHPDSFSLKLIEIRAIPLNGSSWINFNSSDEC